MKLTNNRSYLFFDLRGGAIADFHLEGYGVNPLNFAYTKEQMPVNNQNGPPYKGHFICCGRWGRASERDRALGAPDHGGFSNMNWWGRPAGPGRIEAGATSQDEGLSIARALELDPVEAVYLARDLVTNVGRWRKSFHLVQHPTLSPPFLDEDTIIDSNATIGFNQVFARQPGQHVSRWPLGHCEDGSVLDLRRPERPFNGLFSFLTGRREALGWITAYSPVKRQLFGYLWRRDDYPWIHCWVHWEESRIKYRAIEFGVAGFHNAFESTRDYPVEFMGEEAYLHLDPGQATERKYLSFLQELPAGCSGVADIQWAGSAIVLVLKDQKEPIRINTSFTNF